MFEDKPGIYTPKLADFGFSTYFRSAHDFIQMPKSEPWNAPEHHHRYFELQAAKAMDVYSFGMLVLWLIFGWNTSISSVLSPQIGEGRGYIDFEETSQVQILESWKSKSDYKLLKWVLDLVSECTCFDDGRKNDLADFFRFALALNPNQRSIDFTYLLNLLLPVQ